MRIDSGSTPTTIDAGAEAGKADSVAENVSANNSAAGDGKGALAALSQNTLAQHALHRQHTTLRPKLQSIKAKVKTATPETKASGNSAIDKAEQAFKQRVGERAHNKEEFHKMMKSIYGGRYDQKTVEGLRQSALSGDFGFLPKARFVSDSALNGNHAAYDAQSGTILLNEKLAANPQKLADYYAEEAGHHIDTFFGKGDAVGDEGELLRHALAGTELSRDEIAAIRAEDDTGTITVDGKEIEVEFGFFKKIKKAFKKVGKSIVNGIKNVAGAVWDGIKKVGKWFMTSTIGQYLITGALAALSVVTAGVGTAAMIAWEAAKQAAVAVVKSVVVQKVAGFVGKVTGSETVGRIAGAIGSAFAGGKISTSSTAAFTRTAGSVAKDIAVNETKRVVQNEVLSKIDSPFLQMAAGYAVNYGIDAGADYAYGKLTGPGTPAANDGSAKGKTDSGKAADVDNTQDEISLDPRVYAQKALDSVGKLDVGDAIKQLAPKELRGLLTTIVGGDIRNFTVADLASAVKTGLNNFEGMSANDVAAALQDYARNALESAGNIDRADVAHYASKAFDQAGKLSVQDLVKLSGYDGGVGESVIEYVARETGTTASTLTLNDVISFASGNDDDGDAGTHPNASQYAAG